MNKLYMNVIAKPYKTIDYAALQKRIPFIKHLFAMFMSESQAKQNSQLGLPGVIHNRQMSVIGNIGDIIEDVGKIDSTDLVVHRATYTHNEYYHATNTFYGLLYTLPTFDEMEAAVQNAVSAVALQAALTALPVAGNVSYLYDIAVYLTADRFTPLPATIPTCFSFLFNMEPDEKLNLFKGTWRSRSQHFMVPRVLGIYTFILVMGCADVWAVYATKFHIHRMILDPVSMTQIQFDQFDMNTWVAAHYNAKYPLGLTQDQINNMHQNVFKAFNNFNLIMPVESVKIGKMLCGYLTNNNYKENADIRSTYPIDFIFTTTAFGGGARGFNLMNGAEWAQDLQVLQKVSAVIKNIGQSAQTIEYGDSYYNQVFPSWKETLTYTTFDSESLSEWEPMLGWPYLYISFHDQAVGPYEPILNAWNAANFANYTGGMIDINTVGTQRTNLFMRMNAPEVAQGAAIDQYYGVKLPGHTDELYDLALIFGWFRNTPRMGVTLNVQAGFGDVTNIFNYISYIDYFDSLGNNVRHAAVNINDIPLADESYGWVALTNELPFASLYTPKVRNSAGYGIIAKIKTHLHIAGANTVDIGQNGGEFWEKLKRTNGMYTHALSRYGWGFTFANLQKIFNPFIVEKQKNNPLKEPKLKVEINPDKDKTPAISADPKMAKLDIPTSIPSGGKPADTYSNDKGKNDNAKPIEQKDPDPVKNDLPKEDEVDKETIDSKPKVN